MASRTGEARPTLWLSGALVNVLVLCVVATAVLAVWVLAVLDGWHYYLVPLGVRGYQPAHALLRPSGRVAHLLGLCGLLMMVVPVAYSVRKKWKRLRHLGSLKTWLEVHIFCGVMGPVLVTVHTAGKFNGIISVAYWSMVFVMLSGFVGRYFYVRIPKTMRGIELGYDEIVSRATDLKVRLVHTGLDPALLHTLDAFERSVIPDPDSLSIAGFVFERARIRRGLRRLRWDMAAAGVAREEIDAVLALTSERAALLGRLAYLAKTKRLFGAWHVFHQPLVYVMFAIAAVHVGVVMYLGYTMF